MTDRWTLNRAGILNVYQYGDEIIEFAGGRLLLRGVNGSGKSTAMNMLLPFLLDANQRRIDAAGEQSGVLRSWMLSGREEQQPIGYLWVEFECAGEYLICGCGIRANRSTEKVTTWWFLTTRRPGIDFSLLEGKVPLNADGLKGVLAPGEVFAGDKRTDYRAEVRAKLFGNAEIDQHIALLHVVRSPRVGDRIDTDLPTYLTDALPQLSQKAIDDAAQPLEDLDEHRRSVAELSATAQTLDGLAAVYQSYVRSEIIRRAKDALMSVEAFRAAESEQSSWKKRLSSSESELKASRSRVADLEKRERGLGQEIQAMRDLPIYQEGKSLDDLREFVKHLAGALTDADHAVASQRTCNSGNQASANADESVFKADFELLTNELADLRALCTTNAIRADVPNAPQGELLENRTVLGPKGPLPVDTSIVAISGVATAIGSRRIDLDEVRTAIEQVNAAEAELRAAESRRDSASSDMQRGEDSVSSRSEDLKAELETFTRMMTSWEDQAQGLAETSASSVSFNSNQGTVPLSALPPAEIHSEMSSRMGTLLDELRRILARLEVQLASEDSAVSTLQSDLNELSNTTEPELPTPPWHLTKTSPDLAQLIEFVPGVSEKTQLGLEAALEAAGLLGAELSKDGLRAKTGELLIYAESPAEQPLSLFLTVSIPQAVATQVRAEDVSRVLSAISTEMSSAAHTVVTTSGEFRVGALQGRHAKQVVEHVGASARLAALVRRREAVQAKLEEASRSASETRSELETRGEQNSTAVALLDLLPKTTPVEIAKLAVDTARAELIRLQEVLELSIADISRFDEAHGGAVERCRRVAATHVLPHTRTALDEVQKHLQEALERCRSLTERLGTTSRSWDSWLEAAERWRDSAEDLVAAEFRRDSSATQHSEEALRLATLETSMGVEFEKLIGGIKQREAEQAELEAELPKAKVKVEEGVKESAKAEARLINAQGQTLSQERSCTNHLPRLQRALAVPGLSAALAGPAEGEDEWGPDHSFPEVSESTAGVNTLATFLIAHVPAPASETTAENVRQSLRQRRDNLSAGWDAEDRQPDSSLPLEISVNGPLGRFPLAEASALVQQRHKEQSSLLTVEQDEAIRRLLQGLIATEVVEKLHAAKRLVEQMNARLQSVSTSHGIGATLRWRQRDGLDEELLKTIELMAKPAGLREPEETATLAAALSKLIGDARREQPEASYKDLISEVLDYRHWNEMRVMLLRADHKPEQLKRSTALSEGEKKMVSYLPLFAAVAASCDELAESNPAAPRFLLLDDAFAKVSEDNHAKLFGLLVQLDLDFIATSERLWGTHDTVPELAITEVIRHAKLGVIVLEHARWDGTEMVSQP